MNYKIEDLSITPEILKTNGYKKYSDNLKDKDSYVESWQKLVYNEYGKAYFINFNFYNNSMFLRHLSDVNPYSWDADLQFDSIEDDMTVNVKVFSSSKDLTSVENFCDRMFKKMQFKNYDYYGYHDEENHKKDIIKEQIKETAINLNDELPEKPTTEKKKKKI